MSTRKDQLLRRAAGKKGRNVALTREEKALRDALEKMGGGDWNASEGEPGYVKNRTHYEETTVVNEPLNITWDGNTEGLVSTPIDNGNHGTWCYYKLSSATPSAETLRMGCAMGCYLGAGIPSNPNQSFDNSDMDFDEHDEALYVYGDFNVELVVVYNAGDYFPEKGVYFSKFVSKDEEECDYIKSLTTTEPIEHTKTVLKKLDKKFLPDNIGGGIKYVTIGMDDDDNYTTSATYAEIAEWINAGIDVRCIYGKHILPLVYSDAVGGISMMDLSFRHQFACAGVSANASHRAVWHTVIIEDGDRINVYESDLTLS